MKTITYLKTWYKLYIKDYKYLPIGILGLPLLWLILIEDLISNIPLWLLFVIYLIILFG
jgi:uncharacterized protein (DUF983 family)